jgi:hypothetical protein
MKNWPLKRIYLPNLKTCHYKLEKMTGIPSQDEDTSEKLAVVSKIENNQLVIIVPMNEHRILKVIEKLPDTCKQSFHVFSRGKKE